MQKPHKVKRAQTMTVRILKGDCREVLKDLEDESVHCVVTSPPYFGLRDYGVAGQLGLEPTPDAFVSEMVAVFADVRRVLRKDGTLWLNLGDSYNSGPSGGLGGSTLGGGQKNQENSNRAWRNGAGRADGKVDVTPAAWHGVSAEPLLGPIRIGPWRPDWLITGGESGPKFRFTDPAWVKSLRDQCAATGIAFHHKQWGGIRPKENGCEIDGREHKDFPAALAA